MPLVAVPRQPESGPRAEHHREALRPALWALSQPVDGHGCWRGHSAPSDPRRSRAARSRVVIASLCRRLHPRRWHPGRQDPRAQGRGRCCSRRAFPHARQIAPRGFDQVLSIRRVPSRGVEHRPVRRTRRWATPAVEREHPTVRRGCASCHEVALNRPVMNSKRLADSSCRHADFTQPRAQAAPHVPVSPSRVLTTAGQPPPPPSPFMADGARLWMPARRSVCGPV